MTRDGWSDTTMDAIARESGISQPTLFRYFPTKAHVLWHGMDENAGLFWAEFMSRIQQPLLDAIFDGYLAMLKADVFRLELIRLRMAIVERDTDARGAAALQAEKWEQLVIRMVAEHEGEGADELRARVRGAAVWAALSAALRSWAVTDLADPSAHVEASRQYLTVLESGDSGASRAHRAADRAGTLAE